MYRISRENSLEPDHWHKNVRIQILRDTHNRTDENLVGFGNWMVKLVSSIFFLSCDAMLPPDQRDESAL